MRDATSLSLIALRFCLAQVMGALELGGEIHGLKKSTEFNGKLCRIQQFFYWRDRFQVFIPDANTLIAVKSENVRVFSIRKEGGVLLQALVPPPLVAAPAAPPTDMPQVRASPQSHHGAHVSVCLALCGMRDATSLSLIALRFCLAQVMGALELGGEIHGLKKSTEFNGKLCRIQQFFYWRDRFQVFIPDANTLIAVKSENVRVFSIRKEGGVLLQALVPPPLVAAPAAPPTDMPQVRASPQSHHGAHVSVCLALCGMRDATSLLPLITLLFHLAQNLFDLELGGEIDGLTEYPPVSYTHLRAHETG